VTLVERASGFLERRLSRRSFITRSAFVGSALAVGGVDFLLRPGTAYAQCVCGNPGCDCGSLCCAGYTEFCCVLSGYNACPSNTLLGGWWKAEGSAYCSGPRYYMDCNATCRCTAGCGGGSPFCEPACDGATCECAFGSCDNYLTSCFQFRYGQCNQDVACIGRIVCRVVTCVAPWEINSTCTTANAEDDGTANQNAPCLESPAAQEQREVAFQANTGSLWTVGTASNANWYLGMAPGTSPSITALAGGGFQVAFQANTGPLWTVGTAGNTAWPLGMKAGTSPSIAGLSTGGFEVAVQTNGGDLWTMGQGPGAEDIDWHLGMAPGTSPSITALPGGGFQVAFQANTTSLWTAGTDGTTNWSLGMAPGTSPSITALPGEGGFQVAFQANTSSLWTAGTDGTTNWSLGMAARTSPAITGLPGGGFQVAFQANTSSLWTAGTAGTTNWSLGMAARTSPATYSFPG
jgi:hypothetical protein